MSHDTLADVVEAAATEFGIPGSRSACYNRDYMLPWSGEVLRVGISELSGRLPAPDSGASNGYSRSATQTTRGERSSRRSTSPLR
jgi:hypothetical protein